MPSRPIPLLVSQASPPHEKIALFRSLFRGREDVYPRRFESRRTGRAGYQPACANEWVRGLCEKPRIKYSDCLQRRLLPVTDDVISWHLRGKDAAGQPFVVGVYPLLLDETCHFLAIDFDKAGWQEDVLAFLATCRRFDVRIAERSRSGRGGHVWLFFDQAIPAALARRLGSFLLTETTLAASGASSAMAWMCRLRHCLCTRRARCRLMPKVRHAPAAPRRRSCSGDWKRSSRPRGGSC